MLPYTILYNVRFVTLSDWDLAFKNNAYILSFVLFYFMMCWTNYVIELLVNGGKARDASPLYYASSGARLVVEGPFQYVHNPVTLGLMAYSIVYRVMIQQSTRASLHLVVVFLIMTLWFKYIVFGIMTVWFKYVEEPDLEERFGWLALPRVLQECALLDSSFDSIPYEH